MNKTYIAFGAVILFCLGFAGGALYYHYGKPSAGKWGTAFATSDMIGSYVENPQGEEFGRISDFVIDSVGHVPLAVLSYGEKKVAIPYGAMTYNQEEKHFVLNLSKERLDTAPVFDKSALANRTWVEETYKHFGQTPYWTEEGMEERMSSSITEDNPSDSPLPENTVP